MGEQSWPVYVTRERNGSKLKVTWVPHETRSTTAVVSFECYSTVAVGDDETTVIQNAFTEAITDLIEAFSDEVGSEIATVKASLMAKLKEESRREEEACPHAFLSPPHDGTAPWCIYCGARQ